MYQRIVCFKFNDGASEEAIQADLIKQKSPTCNGGFKTLEFCKTDDRVYSELTTDHPIDRTRYQLAGC